ncbi:unnamed protein product [Discosporangium mesarthrocarpum]
MALMTQMPPPEGAEGVEVGDDPSRGNSYNGDAVGGMDPPTSVGVVPSRFRAAGVFHTSLPTAMPGRGRAEGGGMHYPSGVVGFGGDDAYIYGGRGHSPPPPPNGIKEGRMDQVFFDRAAGSDKACPGVGSVGHHGDCRGRGEGGGGSVGSGSGASRSDGQGLALGPTLVGGMGWLSEDEAPPPETFSRGRCEGSGTDTGLWGVLGEGEGEYQSGRWVVADHIQPQKGWGGLSSEMLRWGRTPMGEIAQGSSREGGPEGLSMGQGRGMGGVVTSGGGGGDGSGSSSGREVGDSGGIGLGQNSHGIGANGGTAHRLR